MKAIGTSTGRAISVAVALLALAALAGPAARSEAAVYWGGSSLGRANLDGGQALWPLPNGWFPALDPGSACGLAVDAHHLYWGDWSAGTIGRATVDGTAADRTFVGGLSAPCGVAVSGSHIYWTDFEANLVGRARLDGTHVEPALIAGADDPCGIAVNGSHVYWTNQDGGSIGRADLDGGDVEQEFISGLGAPCGVDVNSQGIFWGDQEKGSVGRADLDGTAVQPLLVREAGEPWDVAVNASHLYWADRWGRPVNPQGGIGRATLDGAQVAHDLISGVDSPTGVALDDRLLPVPQGPLRPSDYLRFGKLTHHKRSGAVTLVVHVPARGDFRVDTPRIGWSIDKGNPPPHVGGTFRWKLRLWPGRGPASKRLRRQLRRSGRAPVALRVTYQQEGRAPLQASKRFSLVRERKRPRRPR